MAPEEIDTYRAIVRRAANVPLRRRWTPADRQALLRLAYGYIEPRHRHGPARRRACEAEIVAARSVFRAKLPEDLKGAIAVLSARALSTRRPACRTTCSSAASSTPMRRPVERVNALLRETMDALDLTGTDHRPRPRLRHRQRRQAPVARPAAEARAGARAGEAARPPHRQPGARRARRECAGRDRHARARLRPQPRAGRASRYSGC